MILKIYNKFNDLTKHLFRPFPILLGIIVSVIEINDYLTPDPIERVLMQIEDSQKALNELKVVDIPDSLQTDIIKDARVLQQKLIAYAKIINSCKAISSNNPLNLQWQVIRIKNVIEASTAAGNSMVDFISKLGYKHRDEFDLSVMYIPNISYEGDFLDKELNHTIKKLNNAKDEKEKIQLINDLIVSDGVRDFLMNRNDVIRSAFEYLNVVQLSLAYNLDLENISHVTNGK